MCCTIDLGRRPTKSKHRICLPITAQDLERFEFLLDTLEFRNVTWTWFDFLQAIKRDAIRAVWKNTGALVKTKLFRGRHTSEASSVSTGTQESLGLSSAHSRSSSATSQASTKFRPTSFFGFRVHKSQGGLDAPANL
jgi:hypothetical protein